MTENNIICAFIYRWHPCTLLQATVPQLPHKNKRTLSVWFFQTDFAESALAEYGGACSRSAAAPHPASPDPCRADPPLSAAPFPCPPRPVAPPRPASHRIPALLCPALRRAPSRRSQPATPRLSSAIPLLSLRSPPRPAAPRIAAPLSSPREVHVLTSPARASLAGGSSPADTLARWAVEAAERSARLRADGLGQPEPRLRVRGRPPAGPEPRAGLGGCTLSHAGPAPTTRTTLSQTLTPSAPRYFEPDILALRA